MSLHVLRYLWIAFSLIVLVVSVYLVFFPLKGADDPAGGSALVVYYAMAVLGFPAGILGMVAFNLIAILLSPQNGMLHVCGLWLFMFVAGYLQWFYVLPEVVRRFRRARPFGGPSPS